MRPTYSWADLPGLTVGIYGLGTEGEANLRACRAGGSSRSWWTTPRVRTGRPTGRC